MFSEFQVGSVTLKGTQVGNVIYLSDLQGEGNVDDLMDVVQRVKELAGEFDVFLTVDIENPRFEKLMKFYTRYGAAPKAVLMEVNPQVSK